MSIGEELDPRLTMGQVIDNYGYGEELTALFKRTVEDLVGREVEGYHGPDKGWVQKKIGRFFGKSSGDGQERSKLKNRKQAFNYLNSRLITYCFSEDYKRDFPPSEKEGFEFINGIRSEYGISAPSIES